MDELLQFTSEKLLRQQKESYQACRKAWLRYKGKIISLLEKLEEARRKVTWALSTGIL